MHRLGFLLTCCLAMVGMLATVHAQPGSSTTAPTPQNSVWFEQRVGHAVVSRAPSNTEASFSYVFYFAAVGPRPATETVAYGNCLKAAVRSAGLSFIEALNDESSLFIPSFDQIYSKEQAVRTTNALVTARGRYRQDVITNCREVRQIEQLRRFIDGTGLALIKRECTKARCPLLDVPKSVSANEPISEGERRERVFEALFFWARSRGMDATLNEAILLGFNNTGGLDPHAVEVRPGLIWPDREADQNVQQYFESGVSQVLADKAIPALSSVVPSQIALPRATILRTAYAFRNAQDAWAMGTEAPEWTLKSLQDEVARLQITECRVYRAARSTSDVAKCAGYDIDDRAVLECLNGGPCMPRPAITAQAGALLMSARRNVGELSADAFLPRPYDEEPGSFGRLVDAYKACSAENASEGDTVACLTRRLIDPEIATQANCLMNPSRDRISCLAPNAAAGRALRQLKACHDRGDPRCIVEAALPPQWACVAGAQSVSDLGCLAPALGGNAARLAQCLGAESDLNERILCIGGNNVPEGVRTLVGCYSSATTEAGAAVCALGTALPPEQAALIKCAAESGGDPIAAGVCAASPYLGITHPGQQIILQCAAASAGEPLTAAGCIAGRFTLAELQGCQNAEFGESGCFGEGNEFQKLSVALTGQQISKDSVVGQIAIFYIDRANEVIGAVGHVANELGKGAENLVNGIAHELEKINNDPLGALADAPENIVREGAKAVENIYKALAPWEWSL